jgi:hypothetical protein
LWSRATIGFDIRLCRQPVGCWSIDRLGVNLAAQSGHCTGAGGRAAEGAMFGVVEAVAGDLDVGVPSLGVRALVVIENGIQAGETGTGGEEDRQQEECLGPEQSCGPNPSGEKHG